MPLHPPLWTDFLTCSNCCKEFSITANKFPITLLCGHSICKECVGQVQSSGCQFDPNTTTPELCYLGVNFALLQLIQEQNDQDLSAVNRKPQDSRQLVARLGQNYAVYKKAAGILENLSLYLRVIKNGILPHTCDLTKPMLRKLVTLIQSQLALEDGRLRALRACRALGERASTELILSHQNPTTLSVNLWTAVRARGCQFLGPAMQEEALKLILLALEDGSELSRKVLVMFVVQKLQQQFPLASKTSTGHVVQLLYRASCFVVQKRDKDSSLMKLKEAYRTYSSLRREHDAQVVQIAREAGLRIAPDQWSALLYGDQEHKSHMQSVIDRLQSGETLKRCIQDLASALEKSSDPNKLRNLIPHLKKLADVSVETATERDGQRNDWNFLIQCLQSVKIVIQELIDFSKNHSHDFWQDEEALAQSAKFKTSFCRDMKSKGRCPRGSSCSFAHTEDELHHYRNKRKKAGLSPAAPQDNSQAKSPGTLYEDDDNIVSYQEERVFNTTPVTSVPRQKPTMDQTQYLHSNHPRVAHQHPLAMQQQNLTQNIGVPMPPQMLRPSPSSYAGDAYHSRMYMDARYNQQMHNNYDAINRNQQQYSSTQPSNYPLLHSPHENYHGHQTHHNPLPNDRITIKPGNLCEQNLPQFTVTLSFQSKPTVENMVSSKYQQTVGMYQPVNQSNSMTGGAMVSPIVDAQLPDTIQLVRKQYGGQHYITPDHEDNARSVIPNLQQYSGSGNTIQHHDRMMQSIHMQQRPSNNLEHVNTRTHEMMPPMYRFEAAPVYNRDTPVAVVAPQPAVPSAIAHAPMYDRNRNVMFSDTPMQPTAHCMMSQSTNQVQNPPMLIPVVPVTPYQVINQSQVHLPQMLPLMLPFAPPSSVIYAGDVSRASEQNNVHHKISETNATVPISIDCATVEQLEKRKKEILKKMIQKQCSKIEDITMATSSSQLYDVWNCQSYSPLLTMQTAVNFSSESIQCEDYSTNVVDVIAELDTRTTQVTVRGTDHINLSHARNKRTLDDTEMHRMLVEKNDDMNNTDCDLESSQPPSAPCALIHYSGELQDNEEEDDEIIPFSDQPTVSRYGPIARSVRTRPINTDLVQMSANADVDTNSVAATNKVQNAEQAQLPMSSKPVCSSYESLSSVSYFPASFPMSRESLTIQNKRNRPNISSTTGSVTNKKISITQAASNSKLLHREETAVQQNKSLNVTEDLQLAIELQQIEIGIHQKRRQNL